MKRHEVRVLFRAGVTAKKISETTDVPVRSVWRIAGEDGEPPREDAPPRRRPGRPSKADAYRGVIAEILAAEPELPTMEILHRAKERGYLGGKSALYDLVAAMRSPAPAAPLVRFEGLPGEFSQHDFGTVDVRFVGDRIERIHFFASRLKYSRWIDVRVVPDQKVESLVRPLLSAFEAFGGVPLVGVFDNPKTVVLRRLGGKIEWNETFGQVALDYRFAPELCTPARGQEKGAVENLVGFVKGSFFKVRRFVDREDLQTQLAAWHAR